MVHFSTMVRTVWVNSSRSLGLEWNSRAPRARARAFSAGLVVELRTTTGIKPILHRSSNAVPVIFGIFRSRMMRSGWMGGSVSMNNACSPSRAICRRTGSGLSYNACRISIASPALSSIRRTSIACIHLHHIKVPSRRGIRTRSAAREGCLACHQIIALGLGVAFDGGQVRPPRYGLSFFHFNFSEGKPGVQFNTLVTQLSRFCDDSIQFLLGRQPGSSAGIVFSGDIEVGFGNRSLPADFGTLTLSRQRPRVFNRIKRGRCLILRDQRTGQDAPSLNFIVTGFLFLKNFSHLTHRSFLLPGGTRLLERQFSQPQ